MGTYNGTILLGAVWLFSSNLWLADARRPEERRSGADALNEILDWLLLALSAVLFAELLDERAGTACFAVQGVVSHRRHNLSGLGALRRGAVPAAQAVPDVQL